MKVKNLIPLLGDSDTEILVRNVPYVEHDSGELIKKVKRGNFLSNGKASELKNEVALNAKIVAINPRVNHESNPIIFIDCEVGE